jgi:hypothetical protein
MTQISAWSSGQPPAGQRREVAQNKTEDYTEVTWMLQCDRSVRFDTVAAGIFSPVKRSVGALEYLSGAVGRGETRNPAR